MTIENMAEVAALVDKYVLGDTAPLIEWVRADPERAARLIDGLVGVIDGQWRG